MKPTFAIPIHDGANPLAKGTAEDFRKAMDGASATQPSGSKRGTQ